ncbi:unnamed protein product [Urochloa humidicola]
MRRLYMLPLLHCKTLTDVGLGCVAVGCPDLRELSLKWYLVVMVLVLQFLTLKCKKLTSLDLSYTMVIKLYLAIVLV